MRIYQSRTIEIPRDVNLTELLHTTAYPNIPSSHLIASDSLTDRSITLGELRRRAGQLANGLVHRFHPSDQARWAIILPNSVDYLEAFHAVLWTGGVCCPINHVLKAAEIGHALAVSRPHFIMFYSALESKVLEAVDHATRDVASRGVTWASPVLLSAISRSAGLPHLGDLLQDTPLAIPHWTNTSQRLASIHLTSGTSGQPKGTKLSHFNYVSNCHQLLADHPDQFHPASRAVGFTPWIHIAMTTMPLFLGPWTGMFHHAMPSFNLEEFASLVGSIRATSFQGISSVVLSMAKSDITSRHDFSQAQIINVGGAPLKQNVIERLSTKASWKLVNVYGMTEAAGYVAYQRFKDTFNPQVSGQLLPNIEACLKKEGTLEDADSGSPGELWLRGPNITSGYIFNDDANEKAFPIPGWYNTGDVCTIDEQCRVNVIGRTKELIKYKGFQVAPAELEAHINSHPDAVEGGVGPSWDESQLTELPTAWVVLKPHVVDQAGIKAALIDIQRMVDGQVSGYKKLRGGVWQVEKLPKTSTGKILRNEMVAMTGGLCSLDKERAKL